VKAAAETAAKKRTHDRCPPSLKRLGE
jgi:hypothetical protein